MLTKTAKSGARRGPRFLEPCTSLSPLGLWSWRSRLPSSKGATGCHRELAKVLAVTREPASLGEGRRKSHPAAQGPHVRLHFHQSNKQTLVGLLCSFSPLLCLSLPPVPPSSGGTDEQGAKESEGLGKPAVDTSAPLKSQTVRGGQGSNTRPTPAGRSEDKATVRTCPGCCPDPKASV